MATFSTLPRQWSQTSAPAPQQVAALSERMNRALLNIIRDNFSTQYASQAALLAEFRDAVSAHGGTDVDTALLGDFRTHVPLSNHDAYKPFIDKFNACPCREEDVVNLLSPGLPDFFAVSSATSGTTPKVVPKYNHNARLKRPSRPFFNPNSTSPFAALMGTRCRDVKEIERMPGKGVQRIPVCTVTGGILRRALGRYTDDESQMPLRCTSIPFTSNDTHSFLVRQVPGYAVPWAATVIGHLPTFLIIHGLFFLARRDLERFSAPFATLFLDLIRHIDQQWDMLISCIRNGTLPDLEGIGHVRVHLQAQFVADPVRAKELLDIGPPFSCEGWLARIWPNAHTLSTVCSGPFMTVLPKVKFILGPNVALRSVGYRASEAAIGLAHGDKLDEFVLECDDIVEFLDVSHNETHDNLCQAWEVQTGKQYEPILTTRDGLWRYRLGDTLSILGFDAGSGAPVFKYSGRRSLMIRLPHAQITDDQLLAAVQTLNFQSDSALCVQEFTTVVDERAGLPTVGFFVEPAEPLGLNAHQARQHLFDALVAINAKHRQMPLPTIRVVRAGTFAEYRGWKSECVNVTSGQIKVPLVFVQPAAQAWIVDRVMREL